jgi:radical SAM superfamily enzyme YgiQ (UPF0313 family)
MKSVDVCFIIPPSPFLSDERVFMSLGVLKVAAVAEQNHSVDVLDLSGVANIEDVVGDYLADHQPKALGLTATTPQLPAVVKIIHAIRERAPHARIIVGGPHVTLVHAAYVREQQKSTPGRAATAFKELEELADVLVAGDGEKAIDVALGLTPPKVVNADDPTGSLFLNNDEMNSMPWPARHLIDVDSYRYYIDGERALSIVSQLGCPFGCGFCGGRYSPSLRRMRSRSTESVVAEMEHLYRAYGTKGFMFYDDELNVNRSLIVELMTKVIELQERLGVDFRLRGFVKAQLFNEEQAGLMYRAGFRWLLTGFESASPQILANMNKRATVEENTRCIEIAKANNLKVKALMSIGHPGESHETAHMTRDWILKTRPDDVDITLITVYPGTPYYDDAVPHPDLEKVWVYTFNGERLYSKEIDYRMVADYYKGDPTIGYESYVYTDYLSTGEIVSLRDRLEREVRESLNIAYPASVQATLYEHSMGQSAIPASILRSSISSL